MTEAFYGDGAISSSSWSAFERIVSRLLILDGFSYSTVVGRTGDGGADVLGLKNGRRWLFQVKRWQSAVGPEVVTETLSAAQAYGADIPVIVSRNGFTKEVFRLQQALRGEGVRLQLWDQAAIQQRGSRLTREPLVVSNPDRYLLKDFQEQAVEASVATFVRDPSSSALVVLATGLGKTFVAGEVTRRIRNAGSRVLVLAHTVDLVNQLERAFWPFLSPEDATCVVTSSDRPRAWSDLSLFSYVFATKDTVDSALTRDVTLPRFDVVVVDECHHLGAEGYERVLDGLGVGAAGGPFLLGLTATPWRPNGDGLDHRFGEPVVTIDLARGLARGHLANVDYRLFTDNVDWERLRSLQGERFSPRAINRTLFIEEWDDGVVERMSEAWAELGAHGRAIVFCGTVDHATRMAARINALGFTRAEPIYSSGPDGRVMAPVQRSRLIWDFADGRIGALCSVDVLNEGVDVPDVNMVVFQRVTHSRRIFVQQLGRGLRLAPGKDKVIVLDFVSDVRRFAAGLELQRALADEDGPRPGDTRRLQLRSTVTFRRADQEDSEGASFLGQWLRDQAEIEEAGEDVSVLAFPPLECLPRARRAGA